MMRSGSPFLGVVLAAVLFAHSAHALTNGSFETGDLTGWTLTNPLGNGTAGVLCDGSSPFFGGASAGSCALQLNAGNNEPDAILEQSLATLPGALYELSFDIGKYDQTSHGGTASVLVELFDGTALLTNFPQNADDPTSGGSPGMPMLPGNFVRFTTTFIAIGSVTDLRITDQTTNSGLGFDTMLDNFNLTAIPEPSAAVLLLGGLLALTRRRCA